MDSTSNEHSGHDKQAKQTIIENIKKHDCHIALFEPDNYLPGFAYTIGLYEKFRHPEIICFGLSSNVLGAILNHARDLARQGEILTPNKMYSGFLNGYDIQFLPVDNAYYPDYLGYGGWYYDMNFDFPVLQLVWPDKEHQFPWDENFNSDWKFKQPLLDRNPDFKFYESRNLGVYTTQQVLDGKPILYVYHNEDGDWQFHYTDSPALSDARLVCLEEITKIDPDINEIYFLQYGWKAWRNNRDDEWEYEEDNK